jgi:hypothetical protein
VDAVTRNYRATRLDKEDPQEELEDDSDSYVIPGAVRMGGGKNDDYTWSAPDQTESVEVGLSKPAATSAALLLEAELAPDVDEEIALAVIQDRERWLKERNQNAVLASAVKVTDGRGLSRELKVYHCDSCSVCHRKAGDHVHTSLCQRN